MGCVACIALTGGLAGLRKAKYRFILADGGVIACSKPAFSTRDAHLVD